MQQHRHPEVASPTPFISDHEATGHAAQRVALAQSSLASCMEAEAMYFSRRATEERQASGASTCRKCRDVHAELAMAYEFRAHLLTQEVCDDPACQLFAL
jgi:hypothetical protein